MSPQTTSDLEIDFERQRPKVRASSSYCELLFGIYLRKRAKLSLLTRNIQRSTFKRHVEKGTAPAKLLIE